MDIRCRENNLRSTIQAHQEGRKDTGHSNDVYLTYINFLQPRLASHSEKGNLFQFLITHLNINREIYKYTRKLMHTSERERVGKHSDDLCFRAPQLHF